MNAIEGPVLLHELWKAFLPGLPVQVDVLMSWLTMLIIIAFAWGATRHMQWRPKRLQSALEGLWFGVADLAQQVVGPSYRAHMPLLVTLFLFLSVGNLIGLAPGCKSPTSNLSINAGVALVVVGYSQAVALRAKGVLAYLKSFCGPPYWLAPLFILIRVIEQIARPVSLTMRLFGNIMAKEVVLGILVYMTMVFWMSDEVAARFLTAMPLMLRPLVILLGVLVSLIQALVFTMLAMVYIGEALEEQHAG